MEHIDTDVIIHDIVFGKFLNCLLTQYNGVELSDAQLCTLYKKCDTSTDIADIIGYGTFEELP